MNPEQENFHDLRRLLALKRHEQPPPGYFNNFSSEVIHRIRGGETSSPDTLLERLDAEAPWLQRLWSFFTTKPALVGAFGAAVCAIVFGITLFSENSDTSDSGTVAVSQPQPEQPVFARVVGNAGSTMLQDAPASATTAGFVAEPGKSSIFQEFKDSQKPWFERASVGYSVPGGN
jgi:hypothetical protein